MLLHVPAITDHLRKTWTSLYIYVLRGLKIEDVSYNIKGAYRSFTLDKRVRKRAIGQLISVTESVVGKDKAIPVTGREGP
jgi:hypothetical protein